MHIYIYIYAYICTYTHTYICVHRARATASYSDPSQTTNQAPMPVKRDITRQKAHYILKETLQFKR